jgi:SAM-dependent methyltransferase
LRAVRKRYDAQYFDSLGDRIPYYRNIITRRYARLVREVGGSGRLLELGCGDGRLLAELRGDFDVTGIDISEYAVARARQRLPGAHLLVGDVADCDPEAHFDVVVAFNVLEHLPDPRTLMMRVGEMLSEGGRFVFAVPNKHGTVGSALVRLMNRMDHTHISTYSRERWLEIADELGFQQIRVLNATWFGPTASDLAKAYAPILIVVLYKLSIEPSPIDERPADAVELALAMAAHSDLISARFE